MYGIVWDTLECVKRAGRCEAPVIFELVSYQRSHLQAEWDLYYLTIWQSKLAAQLLLSIKLSNT